MEFTAWSFSRRALVDENQLCDGYLTDHRPPCLLNAVHFSISA